MAALVVLGLALVCLAPGLGAPGLWEPHEMAVADEAIARKDGTFKTQPPIGECSAAPDPAGARTLTARSAAWGLRHVGTSDLGARTPLVLLGLLGVVATMLTGWRLASWRAGVLGGLVLLSFPLWALQSRMLLGDIGTATGAALIAYGLCAIARPRDGHTTGAVRVIDVVIAVAAALVGADLAFHGGGVLLGLIPPLAGVAVAGGFGLALLGRGLHLTWRAIDRRGAGPAPAPLSEPWLGVGALVASIVLFTAAILLVRQLFDLGPLTVGTRQIFGKSILVSDCWSSLLGGQWRNDDDLRATYDSLFEQIGFGMYPWAMLVPVALGALATGLSGERSRWAGGVLLGWAAAAWFAAAVFHRKVGFAIFPGVPACALAIGVWLDALYDEREALAHGAGDRARYLTRALPLIGLVVVFGMVVMGKDLSAFTNRLTSLLVGNEQIKAPAGARVLGLPLKTWLMVLGVLVTLPFALDLWLWRPRSRAGEPPSWAERFGVAEVARFGIPAALAATVVTALFWTHGYHRDLSANLSSKHVFQVYQDLRKPGDRLGIMGSMGNAPRYYAGGATVGPTGVTGSWEELAGRDQLLAFLKQPQRVFAMAPASELCAIHRARADGLTYHVIDDSNTRTMLLSNRLDGATDRNPLSKAILRTPPAQMGKAPTVTWDNAIELVGVNLPAKVRRGSSFEVTLVFKVVAPIGGAWKIFAHFDRGSSRIIGDHAPIRERCATSFWQPGDYIVDTFTVDAGNSSFITGSYDVWIGFFTGTNPNWRNMTVTRAPEGLKDGNNRVKVGTVLLTGRSGCGCDGGGGDGAPVVVALIALAISLSFRRRRGGRTAR